MPRLKPGSRSLQSRARAADDIEVNGGTATGIETAGGGDAARRNASGGPNIRATARRRTADLVFEGRGWSVARLVTDTVLLLLGVGAAHAGAPAAGISTDQGGLEWAFPPLVLVTLAFGRAYADRIHTRVIDEVVIVVSAASLVAIGLIALAAFVDPGADPAPLIARAWLFGTAYVAGGRLLLVLTRRRLRATAAIGRPTLIVGAGQIGARVERRLERQPELGLRPVGYLDADPPPADMVPHRHAPVLGGPDDLGSVARKTGVRHVVLSFGTTPDRQLLPLVRQCERFGIQVSLVPRLFESVNVHVSPEHIGGLPLLALRSVDPRGWRFGVKHALDRVAAGLLLALLAPLMAAIAVAVRLSSPGSVLFRQPRVGRDGREFELLKFRSMAETSGSTPWVQILDIEARLWDRAPGGAEGDDRRTRLGAFLRRHSLDELPQLINVLRGEMSLVGPRPERPDLAELFGLHVERYGERHRVKSGITGWAQVHGLRGQTSLKDRVEWDNYYIENWSLGLDLRILAMTIASAFRSGE
jgi:exopolysaccharide biosynthesis polyprenyl glycosylphosphotransferase